MVPFAMAFPEGATGAVILAGKVVSEADAFNRAGGDTVLQMAMKGIFHVRT